MKNDIKAISKIQAVISLIIILVVAAIGVYIIVQTPAPSEKVTLIYANDTDFPTVDPAIFTGETPMIAIGNVYEPPFFTDRVGGEMKVTNWLCDSYEISPDALTYTLHFLEGVKFHDLTELKAEDVVFSIERMIRITKGYSWLWAGVIELGTTEAPDDYTVIFNLKAPNSLFIPSLTKLFVMNKDLLMEHKNAGDYGEFGDYGQAWIDEGNDAGSGPYKIAKWNRRVTLTLTKFDEFRGGWKPNQLDEVIIKIVEEHATIVTMLKKEEIHMTFPDLSEEAFDELKNIPGIVVPGDPALEIQVNWMNTKKAPFDDIHVRRAVSYAFDYESGVSIFNSPQCEGPVPVNMLFHNPNVFVFHQDLEKAKEELNKSRYTTEELDAFVLSFNYPAGVTSEERVGLLLKENLEAIGLHVELNPTTWPAVVDNVMTPETTNHFTAVFASAAVPTPDAFVSAMFTDEAHGSYKGASWFSNATLDEAIETARTSVDEEVQKENWYKAQDIIVENTPGVFTVNRVHRVGIRDYVKGYKFIGIEGRHLYFYWYTIEK